MHPWLLDLLRCPNTGAPLDLAESSGAAGDAVLHARGAGHAYPVRGGIPRFVPQQNYADSFGLQWNAFRRTQLDSNSRVPISSDRFYRYSRWTPDELAGKLVLDVGCGSGRFAEIALAAGARVVALDYSSAVDACAANLGASPNLAVVQGDIYALPFAPGSFDYVYCFGVLQHTPDVAAAFRALPAQLRPGGRLAVDIYPRLLRNILWSKYWVRPITRRMPPDRLFRLVERLVPAALPVSRAIGRIPVAGRRLRYLIPVANYEGVYPLNERQLREWSVLDTFDMLAPAHDHPQTARTLRGWLEDAGLEAVEVERVGFLVGRGRRADRAT